MTTAEDMPQADFIHFGLLGQIVEGAPLFASLVFAPSQYSADHLPAYQIQDTNLIADMVTMAGCEVGMGLYKTADELTTLISSWPIAGVPTVVTSLWLTLAESSTELMKRFYENLKTMNKAEALRQARLSMLNEPQYQHPYHWSPFVMYGVW